MTGREVELEPVDVDYRVGPEGMELRVEGFTAQLTSAARGFFELGHGGAPTAAKGLGMVPVRTKPTVVREKHSGLVRMIYHEIVLRFKPRTPHKLQASLLNDVGLEIGAPERAHS